MALACVQVHKQLAERGVRLASAQVQLSLLSWGPQQQELVAVAEELGITVIAYSPLGLGMLTGARPVLRMLRTLCSCCAHAVRSVFDPACSCCDVALRGMLRVLCVPRT